MLYICFVWLYPWSTLGTWLLPLCRRLCHLDLPPHSMQVYFWECSKIMNMFKKGEKAGHGEEKEVAVGRSEVNHLWGPQAVEPQYPAVPPVRWNWDLLAESSAKICCDQAFSVTRDDGVQGCSLGVFSSSLRSLIKYEATPMGLALGEWWGTGGCQHRDDRGERSQRKHTRGSQWSSQLVFTFNSAGCPWPTCSITSYFSGSDTW